MQISMLMITLKVTGARVQEQGLQRRSLRQLTWQVNSLGKSYYFELNHIVKEQNKVSENDQSTLVGYSGSG
ncbi:hypothetical protein SAMN05444673_4042 [Bacillus sp. OV166]|uniref:hypothetical protein n=1 Tax=Bacillus sp. OV166 TaxID=1882763 RepID=UPI000A2ABE9E|nr:hypothetical protein [Bacillus sp. OV166]SMQ80925.1 hypothetical protein SAMN05444673_4042 [Bacillus sp. OV166]